MLLLRRLALAAACAAAVLAEEHSHGAHAGHQHGHKEGHGHEAHHGHGHKAQHEHGHKAHHGHKAEHGHKAHHEHGHKAHHGHAAHHEHGHAAHHEHGHKAHHGHKAEHGHAAHHEHGHTAHHEHGHKAGHKAHHEHGHKAHHEHGHKEHHEHGHKAKRHEHGHGHKEHHGHSHGHQHGHKHGHGHGHKHSEPTAKPNWGAAYASALGMSAISFVGVSLLALLEMPRLGAMVEYTCLAFAAAVLVADALLHLLPHALEGADHESMSSLGLTAVAGAFSLLVVPELCEWHRQAHCHGIEASGVANLIVEMLHNFVDGIAIGLSFIAGPVAGFEASLAVAAHELPQELGDFMVLRAAGFGVSRLLFWNFAASLTCVLGVASAHLVGAEASERLQRHLMAFTAGSFLTLSLSMIYPQVMASIQRQYKGEPQKAGLAKALCLGVSLLAIYVLLQVGNLEAGHHHGHVEEHLEV